LDIVLYDYLLKVNVVKNLNFSGQNGGIKESVSLLTYIIMINKLCCEIHPYIYCPSCGWKLCEDCRLENTGMISDLHYKVAKCTRRWDILGAIAPHL